ncbi:MAG: Na/Pi cotransporter family protein [Candidatus Pacebacteria bacterium]|nr:Na/Pi cotransporter family protein [Candidatus Paceibacterota bacterium]
MIFQILITVVALVLIFIFSVDKFSNNIQRIAGDKLRSTLQKLTSSPIKGVFLGTVVTSIFQSSTATTVMTTGLVDAGLITFTQSLGLIFGANIGTTITSQLIALNIVSIAPFIIILGFFITKFGRKYNIYGKPIFYFGLIFFCISLITQVVAPVSQNETLIIFLSGITGLFPAIIFGILITILFQSSSITNGLILILAGSGLISFPQGVAFMLGSNIGTTSTTLLVSIPLSQSAKKTAIAHLLFNVLGVIIIIPFLKPLGLFIQSLGGNTVQQIANMHILFNVIAAFVFLITIKQFTKLIEFISSKIILKVDNVKLS